jgi:hypothetical protein
MVNDITITIEPPEEVIEAAAEEADHGDTSVEDQVADRLRIGWELDPHEPDSPKGDFN